jgi:eukaryotic-like serine/threonine-protein kinase
MGEIFLARLEGAAGFEKLYVVKRILPHLADDARFRAMLIAEARIASKMSHANICQVYELGETDGQLYIVMEYLEGITLLPMLRKASKEQGQLDFGLVGGIVQQSTDALHYAHELRERTGEYMGIVHRDVTPSNVFLTDAGVVKVLDFGIAKVKDASAQTQTGTVKGKYAYMAPEQLRGTAIDRRADVFALGVVIYEMLALRRLFQRKTDYLTFRAVMEQPIPDVRRYRPDVPDALRDVLVRALDRDPDQRFDTARQLGTAILDALAPYTRAWTQGDIGDFVRGNFADEISRKSEEVASAIQRTQPAGAGRRSMPLLHQEIIAPEPDDEDDDFPAVDSSAAEMVVPRPAAFHGGTPPPFGTEKTPSGEHQHLQPLRQHVSTQQPVVVVAKRSFWWPIFAVAMVAIAGGALFLVWQQIQNQQPTQVNVISGPAEAAAEASRPPSEQAKPSEPSTEKTGPAPGAAPPPAQPAKPTGRVKPADPYNEVIRAKKDAINRCAQDHGAPPPSARVVIVVATDGRTKSVTLDPSGLNSTPLGTCIKNVLQPSTFPRARDEKQVAVTLKPT